MGVERFFAFFERNFRKHLQAEIPIDRSRELVEGLYVDVNSFLHPLCQAFFVYGLDREMTAEDQAILQELRAMPMQEQLEIIKDCSGLYVYNACKVVDPQSLLMLAVDGVAPKAKMNQQRNRRVGKISSPPELFDPAFISPGTSFMDEISSYFRKTFPIEYRSKIKSAVKIVYSSHRDYGEGEHKIFDQMKLEDPDQSTGKNFNRRGMRYKNRYNVVLGEDSDLALISMLQSERIIWMRGNFRSNSSYSPLELAVRDRKNNSVWQDLFSKHFQFVKIDLVVNDITNRYLKPFSIHEFVVLATMMGNDFIPAIPELDAISYQGRDIVYPRDLVENRRNLRLTKNAQESQLNAHKFEEEFNKLAKGWFFDKQGKISSKTKGFWNLKSQRWEVYPYITSESLGIRHRVRYTLSEGDKYYETRNKEVGTLLKLLYIFSEFRGSIKSKSIGRDDSFMVENGKSINFPNLLLFINELYYNTEELLDSQIAKHEFMLTRKKIPSRVAECSIGLKGKSKTYGHSHFVPEAFTHLNEITGFGIYDAEFTDPHIPKMNRDALCRSWLEGLQYTFLYYSMGMRSIDVRWEYLYSFAPSLKNLKDYLQERVVSSVPLRFHVMAPDYGTRVEIETMDLVDQAGVKIGLMDVFMGTYTKHIYIELLNGSSQVIDADAVQLFHYGFPRDDISGKPILYYTNPQKETFKIKRTFSGEKAILEAVSNKKVPYPSLVEMAFCIMPERVLRLIFSSNLVNQVMNRISDCFPEYYELKEEGALYEAKAQMIYPDLERVSRAIKSLPDLFNVEIGTFNRTNQRLSLLRTVKGGSEVVRIVQDREAYNYPVKVRQSLAKDQGYEKEVRTDDSSGWGNYFGIPKPEYRNAYFSMFNRPKAYREIDLDLEEKKTSSMISMRDFYKPQFMTNEEKALAGSFQNTQINFPVSYDAIPWDYSSLPVNVILNYRFELPFGRHYALSEFRSKLVQDILFISKHKEEIDFVIYFGYRAETIYALLSFFPFLNFVFIGDRKIALDNKYAGESRLRTFELKNFEGEKMSSFLQSRNQKCLLVNHRNDQDMAKKMVVLFKPEASMLYFDPEKLPRMQGQATYFSGKVIPSVYGDYKSRVSRLWVDRKDGFREIQYDVMTYRNKMHVYNCIVRPWMVIQNLFSIQTSELAGFASTVDQTTEMLMWVSYFGMNLSNVDYFAQNREMIIKMMKLVSVYSEQSLGLETTGNDILYGPLKLPFNISDPKLQMKIELVKKSEPVLFNYDMVPSNNFYDANDPIIATVKVNRFVSNLYEVIRMLSKYSKEVSICLLRVNTQSALLKSVLKDTFPEIKFVELDANSKLREYVTKSVALFCDLYPGEEEAKITEFNSLEAQLFKINQEYVQIIRKVKPQVCSLVFRPVGAQDYPFYDGYLHFGVNISPYNHFAYLEISMNKNFDQVINDYRGKMYSRTAHQNKVYYYVKTNGMNENSVELEINEVIKTYYLYHLDYLQKGTEVTGVVISKLRRFLESKFAQKL